MNLENLAKTIEEMKFTADGLIPAVCVDTETKEVLMVAYMNADSLMDTIKTGKTHFWSRSRQKYWMKGESSGHTQEVQTIYTDCDKDTLVVEVKQNGAACHLGYRSCFFRKLTEDGVWEDQGEPLFDPNEVYGKK